MDNDDNDITDECDELYKSIKLADWNSARRNLSSNNSYCYTQYVDDEDCNILHLACKHNSPLDIILSIIKVSSDSIFLQQDMYGLTPLRLGLQFASDDELIKIMIKGCPKAALIIDPSSNSTPLHDAVLYNKSGDIIRQLLIAYPAATRILDDNQDTPLNLFFHKWDMGLQDALFPYKRNAWLKISNVEVISDEYFDEESEPRMISMVHDITLLLFQAETQGTIEGIPPMTSFEAARLALTNTECPWSFFNMIIKMNPDSIYQCDDNGNYLLHIAVLAMKSSKDDNDDDIIDTMVSKIMFLRDLACFHNKDYKLPLHLAIEKGSSIRDEVTQIIFEANPRALETRDLSTHLYPFALAAVYDKDKEREMDKEGETREKAMQQLKASFSFLVESPTLALVNETDSKN